MLSFKLKRKELSMVRYLLAAAVGAATLAMGSGPSEAGASGKIYLYDYYFDAAKTQYAGTSMDQCIGGIVYPGPVSGTETQYFNREWVGNCPGHLF
jgi:hypothetical protein